MALTVTAQTSGVEAGMNGAHARRTEAAHDAVWADSLGVTGAAGLYSPRRGERCSRGVRFSVAVECPRLNSPVKGAVQARPQEAIRTPPQRVKAARTLAAARPLAGFLMAAQQVRRGDQLGITRYALWCTTRLLAHNLGPD